MPHRRSVIAWDLVFSGFACVSHCSSPGSSVRCGWVFCCSLFLLIFQIFKRHCKKMLKNYSSFVVRKTLNAMWCNLARSRVCNKLGAAFLLCPWGCMHVHACPVLTSSRSATQVRAPLLYKIESASTKQNRKVHRSLARALHVFAQRDKGAAPVQCSLASGSAGTFPCSAACVFLQCGMCVRAVRKHRCCMSAARDKYTALGVDGVILFLVRYK